MFRLRSLLAATVVTRSQVEELVKKKLANDNSVKYTMLVDVRSYDEVRSSGKIATAINIPLNSLSFVLSRECSPADFYEAYSVEKPKPASHHLIFYCEHGVRSATAANVAEDFGFTSVSNYPGSWSEWSRVHPPQSKPT